MRTAHALALVAAFTLGALANATVSRAHAEQQAIDRDLVERIAHAMEKQAEATKDVARAVKDAGR